jgi:hypothetical protein
MNASDLQAFLEAAEGIRTLDLLHGKQNMQGRFAQNMPAKGRFRVTKGPKAHPGIYGETTEFGHRMGTRLA